LLSNVIDFEAGVISYQPRVIITKYDNFGEDMGFAKVQWTGELNCRREKKRKRGIP
jgi:hypothetical protein